MEIKDKDRIDRLWPSLVSIGLSLAITAGGWLMASKIQDALLEERIATMQRDMARHELEKGKEIQRQAQRSDDHEQRIIRLEANFSTIQETLSEMKEDLKIIIRGRH